MVGDALPQFRDLFVPKPSTNVGCRGCGVSDLASAVRRCPLAYAATGGDCYSPGYSVARGPVACYALVDGAFYQQENRTLVDI